MSLLTFTKVASREGGRQVLKDVDFAAERGECLVVFGRSGSGKHAFLRLAAGIASPDSGEVRLEVPPRGLPVGYVPNEGGLLNNMTLLQNAVLPVFYHGLMGLREAEAGARRLFDMLGVAKDCDRRPAEVAIGPRRLAQLARALLAAPPLFVLDNPLDDVDAATVRSIKGVLQKLKRDRDSAALVTTGNVGPYLEWGERFLLLREGGLQVFESRKELLASEDPEVRILLE